MVRVGDFDVVTAEDVQLMQGLAQRVTAVRPGGWAFLPRQVRRSDGSVKDVTGANLAIRSIPTTPGWLTR